MATANPTTGYGRDRDLDRHPSQYLALAIGIAYTAVGLIGFAITGFDDFDEVTGTVVGRGTAAPRPSEVRGSKHTAGRFRHISACSTTGIGLVYRAPSAKWHAWGCGCCERSA